MNAVNFFSFAFLKFQLSFSVFFFFSFSVLLNAQEWKLKKEEDGIKVYTRLVAGSKIEEVRCTAEVKARLSAFTAMLKDVKGYPEWAYNCVESKLIEIISDTSQIYYSRTDLPWPASDRDLVFRSSLKQDPKTLIIKTRSYSVHEKAEEKDGVVRVKKGNTSWTLTPKPGGIIQVDYFVSVDPGGSVPAWLANSTITYGPLNTLQRVKKLLEGGKYSNAEFWFVKEAEY